MRIALGQIVSGADPSANLDLIEYTVREAAERGAELVVFPEASMCGFGHRLDTVAEPLAGPWVSRLTEIADRSGVWVAAGMFCPGSNVAHPPGVTVGRPRVRNTLVVAGRGQLASYTKIHLFDAFGFTESTTVEPGSEPVLLDLGGLKVGLTLCYDVRFPSLFTALADAGAELILLPASWGPGPGKIDQWQLLTRARALDSTTFLVACGQADPVAAGVEAPPGAPTGIGHSAVIGPDGVVLDSLGSEPGLLVVDIDSARVQQVRKQIPVLANRRL